jgi:L-iditol 2-dehydrogenase
MRYAVVDGPSSIRIAESVSPVPGPGDILVRMAACGICGSDLEKVYGSYGQPSMRLGHEPAGTVMATGEGVEGISPGDRVFTHHHVPCYSCHLCRHGSETRCPEYSGSNISPCGLAEEYLVPAWNVKRGGVLKLPDSMTFEEAAMIEPLACCVRAWSKCRYERGDSVAVFGVGSTGMMHAMLAEQYGFGGIYCVDVNRFRLDYVMSLVGCDGIMADRRTAETLRRSTGGRGVDLAVVATGSLGALQSALDSVRYGGTVMMFGVPSRGATMSLNMDRMYSREIALTSSYAASDLDTKRALEMVRDGSMAVDRLVTHRYGMADSQKAFDHARSGSDAVKIVITG